MARLIEAAPVSFPFRFVVAGDSGAWPDPTAEAIFARLIDQIGAPQPLLFANLGDFAGPGTLDRHADYLSIVEKLPMPDICAVGNHDLDGPSGPGPFARVHGPMNFDFAYGYTLGGLDQREATEVPALHADTVMDATRRVAELTMKT
ncbi:MAG: metallophosphoesterase [Actinomycetota bacterium]